MKRWWWIAIFLLVVLGVVLLRARESSFRRAAEHVEAPTHDIARQTSTPHTTRSPANAVDELEPALERRAVVEATAGDEPKAKRTVLVRLLDEVTDEPVPFFDVRFDVADVSATSDADGLVRFELDRATRELVLALTENVRGTADRIQSHRAAVTVNVVSVSLLDDDLAVVDVRIPVGPTYRMTLSPSSDLAATDFVVTLRSADPSKAFDVAFANVRDPRDAWVRFRPSARALKGGPPWRIAAETLDGLRFGTATVQHNVGVQRERVVIELEARARIEGTVRDHDGKPIESELVRTERDGASFSDATNRPLLTQVGGGGRYRLGGVPPGEYTVVVERTRYLPFRERVVLVAGEARSFDITLQRVPDDRLGRIEGRVESETGRFERASSVMLRTVAPTGALTKTSVAWSTVGARRVGTFAFDEVPSEEHVVELVGAGLRLVTPARVEVRPGEAPLVFTVHDASDGVSIDVRASDEADAPLPIFRATLTCEGPNGPLIDRRTGRDGRATFEDVPLGKRCRYAITAEGRRPMWGTFDVTNDVRDVSVVLAPGWGTEVFVRDAAGSPLAGAKVSFDGEFAGETDERGELRVGLSRVPTSASVDYRGWKVAPNCGLAPTGSFRTFEPFLNVVLEEAAER